MKSNILDTNIFIYLIKKEPEIIKFFNQLKENNEIIFYSFVTKVELIGTSKLSEVDYQKMKSLLNEFIELDYNKQIQNLVIELKRQKNLKIPDAIIAASPIFTESTLVTRNTKDFQNIPNLKLLNPFD